VIGITIPDTVAVESIRAEDLAGWDDEDQIVSRAFSDRWLAERRSAVLLVPGLVTAGRERNVLINPDHREFAQFAAGKPENVRWDGRLFPRK
jgi:RES domain-containing protein